MPEVKHIQEHNNLAEDIGELMDTYYKLSLVRLTKKTSTVTASLATMLIIVGTAGFMLLFAALAMGNWLGEVFDSLTIGYLLVAAFFFLVLIILVLLGKKWLRTFFRNLVIRKLYE